MHTYIHAYMHTCIHAYMHTCIHAYMHPCIHASMHPCIHASMHPCIHASMHACSAVHCITLHYIRYMHYIHYIHYIHCIHFIHYIHYIDYTYIYIYMLTVARNPRNSMRDCNLLCCFRAYFSHTASMQNIDIILRLMALLRLPKTVPKSPSEAYLKDILRNLQCFEPLTKTSTNRETLKEHQNNLTPNKP